MENTRGPREARTLAPGDQIRDDEAGELYRVLSLVGEGGMGRVFKVERERDGAVFAVKCNQPIDAGNETLIERTRNEAAFLKTLRHPHILPVLATGMTAGGAFWMLMPLLDGASLGGLLPVLRRFPLVWVLEIARAVCSALFAVHAHAIHRDIKPENVFITRDGRIYLLDWGAGKFHAVRRLTTAGTNMGTYAYSSPEQLRDGDSIDARSDLFSVGILIFELLTGQHPFQVDGPLRGNGIAMAWRIIDVPPPSLAELAPELPGYMPELVEKFLKKSREERNRDAAEAARVLIGAKEELRSRLGDPPPIERIFDAYDDALEEHDAERLATQDTEKGPPRVNQSGPRPKLGTVPLAAFPSPAKPSTEPLPVAPAPSPLLTSTGTARMDAATLEQVAAGPRRAEDATPAAHVPAEAPAPLGDSRADDAAAPDLPHAVSDDEDEAELHRKLQAIERLTEDDTPETREILLYTLTEYAEHMVLRAEAAIALQIVGDESCLPALHHAAATDPHPLVRRIAQETVQAITERLERPLPPAPPLPSSRPLPPVAPEPPAPLPPAPTVEARHAAPSPWTVELAGAARPLEESREWSPPKLFLAAVLGLIFGAAVMSITYLLLFGN